MVYFCYICVVLFEFVGAFHVAFMYVLSVEKTRVEFVRLTSTLEQTDEGPKLMSWLEPAL